MSRLVSAMEAAVQSVESTGSTCNLRKLRQLVVVDGLRDGSGCNGDTGAPVDLGGIGRRDGDDSIGGKWLSLRARVWKALLGVRCLDSVKYIQLTEKGEHPKFGQKIRNDAFRTFKNCQSFSDRVSEEKIVRVLNAFVHSFENEEFTYVQGMNVICGVFLYVMPELDAFCCFHVLVTKHFSNYMSKNLDGVSEGCALVKQCLNVIDPELSNFLCSKLGAQPRVFAFAPVMTLCACIPPLEEILKIWDVYLAAGVHLNIVVFASYLILHRDDLMDSIGDGRKFLLTGRDFAPLNAEQILSVALPFMLKLDNGLVKDLRRHASCSET
mmetsp:Transcript_4032/g.5901  ORF Transcript_4032/g.5901 Transcript_4032/m.5901 type:complete len:325 (+) Transcript_4032:37-1011(+)